MRYRNLAFIVSMLAGHVHAQVAQGGEPFGWGDPAVERVLLPMVELPELPLETRAAEDSTALMFRYGTQRSCTADVLARGLRDTLPDGRLRCRLLVRSPGAKMLSLQFDVFDPMPDVGLFLYNEARTFYLGGFTEANELPDGGLATAVVPGDAVVIELVGPPALMEASQFHLASLTHGTMDIFKFHADAPDLRDYDPGYQSAACHVNVTCPAAANWQQVKQATAMFLRPDGNGCTGTLMNNTQQNGTPYFLIAHHCYTANENQWVFYFNYESSTCTGSTGPTTQTITGATVKASDYYDDFDLLQLSSTPPASYQPYYAGWDRSGATPTSGTIIEHPLYDVKKIAFDTDPLTSYTSGGIPFWRCYWNSGLVQSVASGSGLYDQNKRIVGHITSGAQDCSNATTLSSGAVKFSAVWDGAAASNRVRDWLDPANTTMTLDGLDPGGTPPAGILVKAKALLEGPYDAGTNLMSGALRSAGLVPLTEPYSGMGYAHVGGGGGETISASVLGITGPASVVDWVVIELRNKNNSASILATHSALLLRNGNIVGTDGTSDVSFGLPADNYFIAIRHRNHLGVMTMNAQALSATATLKDFSSTSLQLYGTTAAAKTIAGKLCLYAGDANMNGTLKYTNANNDRDLVLSRIGGVVPTNTVNGYYMEDVNLDGVVRYTNSGNDRDYILSNIGGTAPTTTRSQMLP